MDLDGHEDFDGGLQEHGAPLLGEEGATAKLCSAPKHGIGAVEYVGVISVLKDYTPEEKCKACVEDGLAAVMPAVSDWAAIVEGALAVAKARVQAAGEPRVLSNCQALAVALYTYDLGAASASGGGDNFFAAFNDVLRCRASERMQALRPYLYYLMTGLERLPTFAGTVYRGIPEAELDTIRRTYRKTRHVWWSAFTSTSTSVALAKQFAGKGGVVFRIEVEDGRRISEYSHFQHEGEVLLNPNTKLCVMSDLVANEEDGRWYLDMAPVPPEAEDIKF